MFVLETTCSVHNTAIVRSIAIRLTIVLACISIVVRGQLVCNAEVDYNTDYDIFFSFRFYFWCSSSKQLDVWRLETFQVPMVKLGPRNPVVYQQVLWGILETKDFQDLVDSKATRVNRPQGLTGLVLEKNAAVPLDRLGLKVHKQQLRCNNL